jgi:NAD(P)-dependent dehydrogenase (short-subunit alcohol dehydrogenase family)
VYLRRGEVRGRVGLTDPAHGGRVAVIGPASWTGVITGGSSGIGRAVALQSAATGADLVIAADDERSGETTAEQIRDESGRRCAFVRTDVADPDEVEALIARGEAFLGSVRFLVAAAGIAGSGTAEETSPQAWRHVIDVNLSGSFFLAKYGIPALRRAGGGAIVLMGSDIGIVGARRSVGYCASKGGVINLTRALALDCAAFGIRVNCVAPGSTRTPMLEHWFDGVDDPNAALAELRRLIPLGREARPEEIAQVVLNVLSDSSSYMTGSVVSVDGGVTAWYGI